MNEIDNNSCENLILIIGSAGMSVLLILSEILPFIKSVKSNGILECISNIFKKKE